MGSFTRLTILVAISAFAIWSHQSVQAGTTIIEPPSGFWLASKDKKVKLYGPTTETANWHITQWDSPDNDLPHFDRDRKETSNRSQQVRMLTDNAYEIAQSGEALACGVEYGAFAGANNPKVYQKYPSAYRDSPPLSQMRALKHKITLTPVSEEIRDPTCKVTRAMMVTAIVFRNEKSSETFFYQLRLRKVGADPKPRWWARGEPKGKGARESYGFGDNLTSYGLRDVESGKTTAIEIDLLPRIKELLKDPTVDIDRNLDNWVVSSTFHGHAILGNVRVRTQWRSFSLQYE